MSFQISNSIGTLRYNYYRTAIYKNQYSNTIANSRYVKVPVHYRTNEPNLSFLENGYIATSLSVVQKIHIVDGVDYDASLVIEHRSITNQADPFYVCLLLKHGATSRTPIDDVIDGKRDVDLVLNSIIESSNAILYENMFVTKSRVAVFVTPIIVASSFPEMRPGDNYIAPYSDVFSTVRVEPILGGSSTVEGFQEGLGTTQMAGYCTPISETDPDAMNATTIMMDANSGLAENATVNATLHTASNFFGFFLLMLFAVFAAPAAYRYLLLDLVLDNDTFTPQMKLNRMSAVDMATAVIFFAFAFSFINYGVANTNTGALVTGFYVFLFFLTSMIVLQYKRIFNETEYLEQFGVGSTMPSFKDVRNDLGGLIFDNVRNLFFKKTVVTVGETKQTINTFSPAGVMMLVIYLIFYMGLYSAGLLGSAGSFYFISIPTAFFFLSWYLFR